MAETVFTAGGGAAPLDFSVNPSYPGRVTLQSGVARAQTEGGTEYAYAKGPLYALYTLRFEGMPGSDYDGGFDYAASSQAAGAQSLINWFINVAPPGSAGFTYTDAFGKAHSVTFADDRLEFSLTGDGLYDGVITLKEILGSI